jgi:hypothetical protein
LRGSKKRKSKEQLSNDSDNTQDHASQTAAGIRRIAADIFHDHLMMILIRFIGAILRSLV